MKHYIRPYTRTFVIEAESAILAWSQEKSYNMQTYSLDKADKNVQDFSDDIEGSDSFRSNLWND